MADRRITDLAHYAKPGQKGASILLSVWKLNARNGRGHAVVVRTDSHDDLIVGAIHVLAYLREATPHVAAEVHALIAALDPRLPGAMPGVDVINKPKGDT